jgi:primosomal protein N' (replication factor Y)
VDVHEEDRTGLKPILSRSGDLAVFDDALLKVMRWAAVRYVAPLATILTKATPPNLPRRRRWGTRSAVPHAAASAFVESILRGRRPGTELWVGPDVFADQVASLAGGLLGSDASALVVCPTGVEAARLADELTGDLGDRVVLVHPDANAAEVTRAWVEAATRPGSIVIGTRTVAFWPVAGLGVGVVMGEGRRGMKDKATPTTHARDVVVKRSQIQRHGLVLAGLVPSAEALSIGSPLAVPEGRRPWGLVEVVDLRTEDRGSGLLGDTVRAALRAAVAGGDRVLVFTHRRSGGQRCVACRTVRRCARCGSGAFDESACLRCEQRAETCTECGGGRFEGIGAGMARVAAEAGRVVGRDQVGDAGSGRPIIVGTERDLPGLRVDLTIVVDADGPLLAPTYRAGEDGMRLLARAVAAAGRGRGRRGLVQTSNPDHPAIVALRRADPVAFVRSDSAARAAAGFPPGGEIVVLEVEDPPTDADEHLAEAIGTRAQVLGPADHRGRSRWLLQGADLTAARVAVRGVVARWREGGARVRVDADPIDL